MNQLSPGQQRQSEALALVFSTLPIEVLVHWDRDVAHMGEIDWYPSVLPHVDENHCINLGKEAYGDECWIDYVANPVPHWRMAPSWNVHSEHDPWYFPEGWLQDILQSASLYIDTSLALSGTSPRLPEEQLLRPLESQEKP